MTAALAGGLAFVLNLILNMVQLLIFASVVISWVGADPNNFIVQMIRGTTEPMYRPIRPLLRRLPGPIDWSPLIILLICVFLQQSVVRYLASLSHRSF